MRTNSSFGAASIVEDDENDFARVFRSFAARRVSNVSSLFQRAKSKSGWEIEWEIGWNQQIKVKVTGYKLKALFENM